MPGKRNPAPLARLRLRPKDLKPGEPLHLRIFLHKGMVEVFANDRQALVYMQSHKPEDVGLCLFTSGGDIAVKQIKAWKMQPIHAGQ